MDDSKAVFVSSKYYGMRYLGQIEVDEVFMLNNLVLWRVEMAPQFWVLHSRHQLSRVLHQHHGNVRHRERPRHRYHRRQRRLQHLRRHRRLWPLHRAQGPHRLVPDHPRLPSLRSYRRHPHLRPHRRAGLLVREPPHGHRLHGLHLADVLQHVSREVVALGPEVRHEENLSGHGRIGLDDAQDPAGQRVDAAAQR